MNATGAGKLFSQAHLGTFLLQHRMVMATPKVTGWPSAQRPIDRCFQHQT